MSWRRIVYFVIRSLNHLKFFKLLLLPYYLPLLVSLEGILLVTLVCGSAMIWPEVLLQFLFLTSLFLWDQESCLWIDSSFPQVNKTRKPVTVYKLVFLLCYPHPGFSAVVVFNMFLVVMDQRKHTHRYPWMSNSCQEANSDINLTTIRATTIIFKVCKY